MTTECHIPEGSEQFRQGNKMCCLNVRLSILAEDMSGWMCLSTHEFVDKLIMSELERNGKEAVMASFKVLSQHLPGKNEEKQQNIVLM
jgi:hypothetical protein